MQIGLNTWELSLPHINCFLSLELFILFSSFCSLCVCVCVCVCSSLLYQLDISEDILKRREPEFRNCIHQTDWGKVLGAFSWLQIDIGGPSPL